MFIKPKFDIISETDDLKSTLLVTALPVLFCSFFVSFVFLVVVDYIFFSLPDVKLIVFLSPVTPIVFP